MSNQRQFTAEFKKHVVEEVLLPENKRNLKLIAGKYGIDPTLVDTLGKYSPIPAVYAGGIKDISDIELIEKSGKDIVHYTIGSALDIFGGTLSFEEVVSR
jgi:phosphoribosylformimino-5-aminoimidazole carboxamide ribonucleotide (ProFAR) isomerase